LSGGPGGSGGIAPQSGLWWNAAEAGRGFALDAQNGHLLVAGMMYDPDGAPVWYISDGIMGDGGRFQADLLRFSNGQVAGGAYVAPSQPAIAGSLELDFTAADRATLTLADLAGAKSITQVELRPQHAIPPANGRPKFLDGSFSQVIAVGDGLSSIIVDGIVTLARDDDATDGSAHYVVQSASAKVRYTGFVSQDEGQCAVDASALVALTGDDGEVDLQADGAYSGSIAFSTTLETVACSAPLALPLDIEITLGGTFEGDNAAGPQPGVPSNPGQWTQWNLVGRND
jgi:hypothetical protein